MLWLAVPDDLRFAAAPPCAIECHQNTKPPPFTHLLVIGIYPVTGMSVRVRIHSSSVSLLESAQRKKSSERASVVAQCLTGSLKGILSDEVGQQERERGLQRSSTRVVVMPSPTATESQLRQHQQKVEERNWDPVYRPAGVKRGYQAKLTLDALLCLTVVH